MFIITLLFVVVFVRSFGKWKHLTGERNFQIDPPEKLFSVINGSYSHPSARIGVYSYINTNRIYIFGGEGWGFSENSFPIPFVLDSLWRYSIDSNTWSFLGNSTTGGSPWPTALSTGIVLRNMTMREDDLTQYYVFGGMKACTGGPQLCDCSSNEMWKLTIRHNDSMEWMKVRNTTKGNLDITETGADNITRTIPFATFGSTSISISPDLDIIFGGGYAEETAPFLLYVNSIFLWNGSTFSFIGGSPFPNGMLCGSMTCEPSPRTSASVWLGGDISSSNHIYIFGGSRGALNYLNDLWKFNLDDSSFTYVSGTISDDYVSSYRSIVEAPNQFSMHKNSPSARGFCGSIKFLDEYLVIISGETFFYCQPDMWVFKEEEGWMYFNNTGDDVNTNVIGNGRLSGRLNALTIKNGDKGFFFGFGFGTVGIDGYDYVMNDFWYFEFDKINQTLLHMSSNETVYNPILGKFECLNKKYMGGKDCNIPICNEKMADCDDVCSRHGDCVYDYTKKYSYCQCKIDFYGINCEENVQPHAFYDEIGKFISVKYQIDVQRMNHYVDIYNQRNYESSNEEKTKTELLNSEICVMSKHFANAKCSTLFNTTLSPSIFHDRTSCSIHVTENSETSDIRIQVNELTTTLMNGTRLFLIPLSTTTMLYEFRNDGEFVNMVNEVKNEVIHVVLMLPIKQLVVEKEDDKDDVDTDEIIAITSSVAVGAMGILSGTGALILLIVFAVLVILLCCCFCGLLFVIVFAACFLCIFLVWFVMFVCCTLCGCGTCLTYLGCTMRRMNPLLKLTRGEIDMIIQENTSDHMKHLKINKELFLIDYAKIRIIRQLGEGGSDSIVFKASLQGRVVAFKCFKTNNLMNQDRFEAFEREVGIMSSLHHENILQFYGATFQSRRIGIVMEYAEFGDLVQYMTFHRKRCDFPIPEREKVRFLKEIASAIRYLHSRSIIHRDLKPENVLVGNGFVMKLMDFGLSKVVRNPSVKMTKRLGTSFYMAPEIVQGFDRYDEKVDTFSFGILVIEIMKNDFLPYGTNYPANIEFRVANDPTYRPQFDLERDFGEDLDWLCQLMQKCWSHDPSERPNFVSIDDTIAKFGDLQQHIDEDLHEELGVTDRTGSYQTQFSLDGNRQESSKLRKLQKSEPHNLKAMNATMKQEIEKLKSLITEAGVSVRGKIKEEEDEIQIQPRATSMNGGDVTPRSNSGSRDGSERATSVDGKVEVLPKSVGEGLLRTESVQTMVRRNEKMKEESSESEEEDQVINRGAVLFEKSAGWNPSSEDKESSSSEENDSSTSNSSSNDDDDDESEDVDSESD